MSKNRPTINILSLYWLIIPKSEFRKLKYIGKVLSIDHDEIAKILTNKDYFEFAWMQESVIHDKISVAKKAIKDKNMSVLLLCNRDTKEINNKIDIKVFIWDDFIEEKNIGKIFSIRRY